MKHPSDSLFDDKTFGVLAENANGTECSIIVNSILTDLQHAEIVKPYRSVYMPYEMGGIQNAEADCRVVGAEYTLENGTLVQLAFDGKALGYLVDEVTFVPSIYFLDQRKTKGCSSALFYAAPTAFGHNIVATKNDEEVVVAAKSADENFVVARPVLNSVACLVDPGQDGNTKSAAWDDLKLYLDIETVINEIDALDEGESRNKEKSLRLSISKIISRVGAGALEHTDILLDRKAVDGKRTAEDRIEEVLLRREDGKFSIVYQCEFPHATEREAQVLAEARLGDDLGSLVVENMVVHDDTDKVLQLFVARLQAVKRAETEPEPSLVLRVETLSAEQQEWLRDTTKLLTEHFARWFPEHTPIFAPIADLDSYSKDRRLALLDISDKGIDLSRPDNLALRRTFFSTKADKRLVIKTGRLSKLKTNRCFTRNVANQLVKINPRISETIWCTDKYAAQIDNGGVVFTYVWPESNRPETCISGEECGSDIKFRPVVVSSFKL